MAILDHRITETEVAQVHVEARPTVLTGTALENKKVFDKYSDMIVEHFNAVLTEIDTSYPVGITNQEIDDICV